MPKAKAAKPPQQTQILEQSEPGKVHVDVQYDRGTQMELAKRAPDLATQLSTHVIKDQWSVDRANELILAGKEWCDSVDRIMDPVREATHKAWKSAIKAQDEFKAPVLKPLAILKTMVTAFVVKAQEEARQKQIAAEAEARRVQEAEAKRVADELKALGASKTEIKEAKQEVLAAPVVVPAVAPAVEASAGQTVRMLYSVEIVSLEEFLKHLVQDKFLLTLFAYSEPFKKAIHSELRGIASDRKEQYSIPGTRLVKTPSGAWRG